jgi:L-alanine-DL-glutamate epimerase-like enolase superfamily enzyme
MNENGGMKITYFKNLRAGVVSRNVSFLKLITDQGLIGWAEFREGAGNFGLSSVMDALRQMLIGRDPREVEANSALLRARTFQTAAGLNQQAIAVEILGIGLLSNPVEQR